MPIILILVSYHLVLVLYVPVLLVFGFILMDLNIVWLSNLVLEPVQSSCTIWPSHTWLVVWWCLVAVNTLIPLWMAVVEDMSYIWEAPSMACYLVRYVMRIIKHLILLNTSLNFLCSCCVILSFAFFVVSLLGPGMKYFILLLFLSLTIGLSWTSHFEPSVFV